MFTFFRRRQPAPAPKPVTYQYDGILTEQTLDHVQDCARKYPFAIEMRSFPGHHETNAIFPERSFTTHGEDCMGQPRSHHRDGIPYALLPRDGAGTTFVFLPDADAHDRICAAFPDLVIDATPFRTVFPLAG